MKTDAPTHLSRQMKAFWRWALGAFELEAHDLARLRLFCEAIDRKEAARAVLDKEGLTYNDRFDAPRARPEVAIERDARLAAIRVLREMNLDAALAPEAIRPPGLY